MQSPIPVNLRLTAIIFAGMVGAGCATAPAPLTGDFPEIHPDQVTERSIDARVRWGGNIIDTRPGEQETCIEVLARDLARDQRPQSATPARGRFLACRDGFQDPAVFSSGRDITVVGRLTGFVTGKIGEFEYTYPKVDANVFYLWAAQPDIAHYYADPWWYDPWWPRYHYPYRYPRTRFSGHVVIRR